MNRSALQIQLEIEAMSIIIADRIPLLDLVKRTFRSKFSREMVTQERKTPPISEDPDTICFMKYLLHNRVKAEVVREFEYEEMNSFKQVSKFIAKLPKKIDVRAHTKEQRAKQEARLKLEEEILSEAFI